MRPPKNWDKFIEENREAFLTTIGTRRIKGVRRKTRSREEFLAIGVSLLKRIKKAEEEGRFYYSKKEGLQVEWNK